MEISIICPIYNEEKFIVKVINDVCSYPPSSKQLILIDGNSTDNTINLIKEYFELNGQLTLLVNEKKYVPFALNYGIKKATGDVIVRIDAHSDYASDYFTKIIETFEKTGADIVGGPTRTKYLSPTQEAIAYSISNKFGIGGSKVHDLDFEGYTDSVTFGAWRKNVFKEIGFFDERLIRNQDDEFHYRAKSKGLRIYQNPEIKMWYYPRDNFSGLFRQYFQYGLYKPLVLNKIKSEAKFRHLIPVFWVSYLVASVILWQLIGWPTFIPLILYLVLILSISVKSKKNWNVGCRIPIAISLIHFAYGIGFLFGIIKVFGRSSN